MDEKENDMGRRKSGKGLTWTSVDLRRSTQVLTVVRLEKALRRIALLIASGRQEYLPIFLRLEKELASCKEKQDAVLRAKRISEGFSE